MMRWILGVVLLVSLLMPTRANAQTTRFTISGYVEDSESGEKLPGANLYAPVLGKGTVTNTYGFFSLTLEAQDSLRLMVSYIGFQPTVLDLVLDRDLDLTIGLSPEAGELGEVEVVAERTETITNTSQMSQVNVPIAQIKAVPALLGEVDVLKTLQLLPGVQSGSEGTSGLYVRGGGPDQNLILLDGAPVYNASHLFGFFSVFNADALRNVTLTKGGFPARYGGRLSSVIDISMKEGNMNEVKGAGAIGLIASRLTVEGPIRKGTTSFLLSGRRTYADILARPFIAAQNRGTDDDVTGGYFFYDINAKINHIFSRNDRVYLSFYGGRDRFYARETYRAQNLTDRFNSGLGWGNLTGTLRWNHVFSNKLFSNTLLTFSEYEFDIEAEQDEQFINEDNQIEANFFGLRYFSGIRDWSGRIDFDYVPRPEHYIRFGASATAHRFSPGASQFESQDAFEQVDTTFAPSPPINAGEFAAYIDDDMTLGSRLKVNAGLHASALTVGDEVYTSLQPRLSTRFFATADWALKASFASMTQYIHLLTNSGIGLPTDLWLPATERVPPQRAWQAAAGVARTFPERGLEFSIEGYYKHMRNLIEYKPGANFIGIDTDWQDKIEIGEGWSYGTEVFLQKQTGRVSGWLGYTLSWTERQFDNLNEGVRFPYRYDRRHDFSAVVNYEWKPNRTLSASWVYGTGNAVTLPIGLYWGVEGPHDGGYGPNGNELRQYTERNGYRMRAYHRLDVGINFTKKKRWGERTISVGAYNAYSRRNPFYIYLDDGITTVFAPNGDVISSGRSFKQVSLFPIIPSFSYSFSF